MTQKILVTGGTGFIGRPLVAQLASAGHHVHVLSRTIPDDCLGADNITYFAGDFVRAEDTAVALKGVTTVYHLAVTTVPGRSNEQIQYDAHTNLMGSLALIDQAARMGVRRFVFTSSGGSIYGPVDHGPIAEDHPANPISAHGVSKLAIEKYLHIFERVYGMEYRVARGGNPYGVGQVPFREQGFIAHVLGCLAEDREIVIWGDGHVERDFIYISDVVEALYLLLDDQGSQQVYNVGSGHGRSLNDILKSTEAVTGLSARVRYEASRPADVPFNCLDISRIRRELGWAPRVEFSAGLETTWRWIQGRTAQQADALANMAS